MVQAAVFVATLVVLLLTTSVNAFAPTAFLRPTFSASHTSSSSSSSSTSSGSRLFMGSETKAAELVSGEELEKLLTEMDQPLVIDAYATWCGPCLLMAPEFEAAAQELKGKVRFVKLDTDQDETMAARLNIMGLPTLLFLDKYLDEKNPGAAAVLKGRIEGALRKPQILQLVEHYFFDGPAPQLFG